MERAHPSEIREHTHSATVERSSRVFGYLIGASVVMVVLQGLWAGLFIREGQANNESWVDIHADGGLIALGLAILACAFAVLQVRGRPRWLVAGGLVYAALIGVEVYLGNLVGDTGWLTAIHIPLALVIVAFGATLFHRSWG